MFDNIIFRKAELIMEDILCWVVDCLAKDMTWEEMELAAVQSLKGKEDAKNLVMDVIKDTRRILGG